VSSARGVPIRESGVRIDAGFLRHRRAVRAGRSEGQRARDSLPVRHSALGFRNASVHDGHPHLVKKGFVVFAVDPVGQGERLSVLGTPNGKRPVSASPRSSIRTWARSASSPVRRFARYMIWDGMRANRLPEQPPRSGPRRDSGVTGRSGGGTQAAYLGAMGRPDQAAAPENYITTFRRLIESRGVQDAEQNFPSGIASGIDLPDLLAAPLLGRLS